MHSGSYYYQKTVDRSVSKLIQKQYPEDEFVLDDDVIIVLTKVNIRSTNPAGETDDEDSGDEFEPFYIIEEDEMNIPDSDIDDFIDDRPESELTDESDKSAADEDEEEEGREYDSKSKDESDESSNENYSENDEIESEKHESESENQEIESENDGNGSKNYGNGSGTNVGKDDDDDDDEGNIKSPRKRARFAAISDDDSLELSRNTLSGEESETLNSQDEHQSAEDEPPAEEEIESSNSEIEYQPVNNENQVANVEHQAEKDVNTFGVYLAPKIYKVRTCLRYHGRIGMGGIKRFCKEITKRKFCDLIHRKRVRDGYTRINLMYVNARHLEYRKSESNSPKAVRKLLIHIIDQYFPVGIPQDIHLDRATNLLERLKRKITAGKVPKLKHSNKFYEMIPHLGDPRRRPRFKDTETCDNKLKYVDEMRSAVKCFEKCDGKRDINPLDYFMEEFLRIDLKVLDTNDTTYQILNEVIENTQHRNASRQFSVQNIFQVDNMNADANGDFSTEITMNHRYLFHFTFASNLPCILRDGLLVAPKHIHSINRFLGDGIYFWDAIANAGLNYRSLNIVYVLVCRVALGKMQQVDQQYLQHDETFHWDEATDSIYCLGNKFSSSRDDEKDLNGAKIYSGKLGEKTYNSAHRYSLYNEYVVRNKNQVMVEYIVKLEKINEN